MSSLTERLEAFLQRLSFGYNNAAISNPKVDGDVLLDILREELPPFIELELLRARLDEYQNFVWPHDGYGTTQAVQEARQGRIADLEQQIREREGK